jgi:hypothetical protein
MTKVDILQGTFDMLVLKTISNDPMHGLAIALRIRQLTDEAPDRRRRQIGGGARSAKAHSTRRSTGWN